MVGGLQSEPDPELLPHSQLRCLESPEGPAQVAAPQTRREARRPSAPLA